MDFDLGPGTLSQINFTKTALNCGVKTFKFNRKDRARCKSITFPIDNAAMKGSVRIHGFINFFEQAIRGQWETN